MRTTSARRSAWWRRPVAPRRRKWSMIAMPSAPPSIGSVPAPISSSSTRAGSDSARSIAAMLVMCHENVLRLAAIDCSSPMSAKTERKTGSRDPAAAGTSSPACAISAQQPDRLERHRLAARVRARDDQHASPAAGSTDPRAPARSPAPVVAVCARRSRRPVARVCERVRGEPRDDRASAADDGPPATRAAVGATAGLDAVDEPGEPGLRLQDVQLGRRLDRPLEVERPRRGKRR